MLIASLSGSAQSLRDSVYDIVLSVKHAHTCKLTSVYSSLMCIHHLKWVGACVDAYWMCGATYHFSVPMYAYVSPVWSHVPNFTMRDPMHAVTIGNDISHSGNQCISLARDWVHVCLSMCMLQLTVCIGAWRTESLNVMDRDFHQIFSYASKTHCNMQYTCSEHWDNDWIDGRCMVRVLFIFTYSSFPYQ